MSRPIILSGYVVPGHSMAARAGLSWIVAICAATLLAPLSPYDVDAVLLPDRLGSISLSHLLGTDDVGRDILTRILYGGRLSLLVGVTAAVVAAGLAVAVAVLAAAKNVWLARSAQRLNEGFNAFPAQFALIVIYGVFGSRYSAGSGTVGALILGGLIGAFSWPTMTPIIALRIIDFYNSPRMASLAAIGAHPRHVFRHHLLPMMGATIWPLLPAVVGDALVAEGTLSFLGFGFQPPVASWGTMMATGESYILQNPLMVIAPGVALVATVASLLAVGEAARRALA